MDQFVKQNPGKLEEQAVFVLDGQHYQTTSFNEQGQLVLELIQE